MEKHLEELHNSVNLFSKWAKHDVLESCIGKKKSIQSAR